MKNLLKNFSPLFLIVTGIISVFLLWNISFLHGSDNDMSRLAGVIAVAKYRELSIDQTIHKITLDRIEYNDHTYSSKPPVLHVFTGEIIHWFFQTKPVLLDNAVAIYRASTAIATVFPLLGTFILFYLLIKKDIYKRSDKKAIFWSVFLIFGTLIFAYSRYLTNHILETFLQIILFLVLKNKIKHRGLIIGFLLSAIFAIDITYGFIVIPVTIIYLFIYERNFLLKNFLYFIAGGIPLTFAHFYLSFLQFETIFPPQLFPEKYLSYPGSKWIGDLVGMEAQNHPFLIRLFNYMFGTYGLFLYQPVLLFAFFGKSLKKNKLWLYTIAITFGYILFNAVMQPNYGGSSFGPRRFLPLIPLLLYFSLQNAKRNLFFAISVVFTIIVTALGVFNTWGNWDYFMNIDESRDFYFPLLYTTREMLRRTGLEYLIGFTYRI